MEEIWKVKEGYNKYQISNLGRFKNKNNELIELFDNENKFIKIYLTNDFGKQKMFYVHLLVCELFIPNENEFTKAAHKTKDTHNNSVDNLKWIWSNKKEPLFLVGEIWKPLPNYLTKYEVSNFGRIKDIKINKILKYINKKGYLFVILKNIELNKTQQKSVHQLVAMAFLNHIPCGHKLVVNHINMIKTDNRVENLELITQQENWDKFLETVKDKTKYTKSLVNKNML